MDDYKKLKADYDRMSAAAQQKIIAEHVATRDAEIARLKAERDAALAACAEMRAACAPLLEWLTATMPGAERLGSPGALIGPGQVRGRDVGLTVAQARVLLAILSRPDLGRGMVAVPRAVVERARKALGSHETCGVDFYMAAVADLDALLDGGKGRG